MVKPMDYNSTQVNLPGAFASELRDLESQIPQADIHPTEKNDISHITILYGLHSTDPGPVSELLEGIGLVRASIIGMDVFKPEGKDYEVVVMPVDSPDLCALHEGLAVLPHTNTYPVYRPHCTVAYVLPGTGDKYKTLISGLEGRVLTFDTVVFSAVGGKKTYIPLTKLLDLNHIYKTLEKAVKNKR